MPFSTRRLARFFRARVRSNNVAELIQPFAVLERAGLREGQRVADLGCGSIGHFIFPAAQIVGGDGFVFAVDIQRSALDRIVRIAKERRFFNVSTVWSDIDLFGSTRIDDGSLDMTLLINNLFLSKDRQGLLREMARLTRVNGKIVVVDWKTSPSPIGPPLGERVGSEEAKKMFTGPFFQRIDEFEAGPYHYGLVFRRTEEREGL